MSPAVIGLEIGLGVLLIAALIYSIRLDGKLKALRERQAELAKVVAEFNQAAERAEKSIQVLKLTSEDAGKDLEHHIHKANALSEELRILNDLGEAKADRVAGYAVQDTSPPPSPRHSPRMSQQMQDDPYPYVPPPTRRASQVRDTDDIFDDVAPSSAHGTRLEALRKAR